MIEYPVTLTLPAQAQYMVTVRLVASSLAGQAGFDVEEIEDVKSAVAEACLLLMPHAGSAGTLQLEFLKEDGIRARVQAHFRGKSLLKEEKESEHIFGQYLLEALMDRAEFYADPNGPTFELYRALPRRA